MAVSYEAFKNVRVNPAIVAAATELSLAHEAAKQDPRYADLTTRYGHQAADFLITHYGRKAFSSDFSSASPAQIDLSKQIAARIEVFNWTAALMQGANPDAVQRRADTVWDSLTADQRTKLAKDPGSGASILADVGKGPLGFNDPQGRPGGDRGAGDPSTGGAWVNGQWVLGADRASAQWITTGARDGGTTRGSSAYSSLSGSWNPSMGGAGLNSTNFGGTPFATAGLDLGTTQSLFAQGYNQSNIIGAAKCADVLGLDKHNKVAMEHMAGIDKYDPDKKHTVDLAKKYKDELDHDDDYQGLRQQLNEAPAEKRKDILQRMKAKEREHAEHSGWRQHIDRSPTTRAHHYRQGVDDDINSAEHKMSGKVHTRNLSGKLDAVPAGERAASQPSLPSGALARREQTVADAAVVKPKAVLKRGLDNALS